MRKNTIHWFGIYSIYLATQIRDSTCYSPPDIFRISHASFPSFLRRKGTIWRWLSTGYPLVWYILKPLFTSTINISIFFFFNTKTFIDNHKVQGTRQAYIKKRKNITESNNYRIHYRMLIYKQKMFTTIK